MVCLKYIYSDIFNELTNATIISTANITSVTSLVGETSLKNALDLVKYAACYRLR